MGSGESTTRKVSFGVDDEDRVRILRGVKLSEDVLQRMKGVANIPPERKPSSNSPPQTQKDSAAPTPRPQQSPQSRAQPKTPNNTSKPTPTASYANEEQKKTPTASYANEEQKKFERQQSKLKEDLARAAQKESEAAKEEMIKAMSRDRHNKRQEAERAKQLSADEIEKMAQQLQKKDSQLRALDAFYKEQLALLEKRNMERYQQSKDQFHDAANMAETTVRSRSTDPVCTGLQAQILSCYRVNRDQTLKCSDLAKEYMQCIDAAKKNLLVNHG